MQVRDVMTVHAECVRPEDSLRLAASKMRDLDVGPLPVCGPEDRLVGMITDRDITIRATAEGRDPNTARVEEIMTPDVIHCFEDQGVDEAAELMQENQVRRLVVLNRNDRLVGIVSLGDLAVETGDMELAGTTIEAVSEPSDPRR